MSPGDERSPRLVTEGSSNNTIAGGDKAEDTSTGLELAVANAEAWWIDEVLTMISLRSEGRRTICACDVFEADHLGAPDHVSRMGAAFRIASTNHVIEIVGYHQARRRSRQGGVHAVWQGVA